MRILVIGINYSPELTGVGRYTGEMVDALVQGGHEVRVVTAPPYYPEWRVAAGHSAARFRVDRFSNLTIYRCPLWVPSRPGTLKRILHLASFAFSSMPVALWQAFWKPEIVWTVEPPLFVSPAAIVVAKLSGACAWLHVQDYEIDAAFGLGILKGGRIRRAALAVERILFRRFDRISSISNRMLARAQEKGVPPEKLVFFPNWVDISHISPLFETSPYRAQLDIPEGAVVALYSGNMAGKQGLEILGEVAQRLRDHGKLVFVFCGDGRGKAALKQQCSGLKNVQFLSLQPMERLNELLGMADIHLLPQHADAADLVMPSKLTGMLASGRPVIATAAVGTELAMMVNGRGLVTPPGDGEAFAAAILELAGDHAARQRYGVCAREYAKQYLGRHAVLARFEQDLLACMNEKRSRRSGHRHGLSQRSVQKSSSARGEKTARPVADQQDRPPKSNESP